ncbi:MAG: septum formation initiator family protein [Ilumatobacteraceae bacterium]|nr:septum formation initiator family protein [Ilumatobacteraceae bacterium]
MSGKSTSTIARPDSRRRASDRGRSRLGDITRPIHIDRRITKQRRSTALLALVALAIAGALAAALFVLPVQTYFGQNDRLDQRRDQLAQLEQVNDDLRSEVDRLRTDDGVREAARVELGMVEAGERRQSVLALPDVPTELPDGWPYSLVSGIAEMRRQPPPPAAAQP